MQVSMDGGVHQGSYGAQMVTEVDQARLRITLNRPLLVGQSLTIPLRTVGIRQDARGCWPAGHSLLRGHCAVEGGVVPGTQNEVGSSGEVNRQGMHVDARDGEAQPLQYRTEAIRWGIGELVGFALDYVSAITVLVQLTLALHSYILAIPDRNCVVPTSCLVVPGKWSARSGQSDLAFAPFPRAA